jgi:hypothetical protein
MGIMFSLRKLPLPPRTLVETSCIKSHPPESMNLVSSSCIPRFATGATPTRNALTCATGISVIAIINNFQSSPPNQKASTQNRQPSIVNRKSSIVNSPSPLQAVFSPSQRSFRFGCQHTSHACGSIRSSLVSMPAHLPPRMSTRLALHTASAPHSGKAHSFTPFRSLPFRSIPGRQPPHMPNPNGDPPFTSLPPHCIPFRHFASPALTPGSYPTAQNPASAPHKRSTHRTKKAVSTKPNRTCPHFALRCHAFSHPNAPFLSRPT